MEPNAKKKLFICKFCNKQYPCGKSLGGHIRIHLNGNSNVIDNSTDTEVGTSATANVSNSNKELELVTSAQSGYGLRENPKKTKRFMADSKNGNLFVEKVCKECGKGFQSLKALCGHMACHSKNSFEDQSETSNKLKDQVPDSQSDTEASSADSAPSKRRRSKRMRYKTIRVHSSSLSLANGCLSSASDTEQEQEEVAKSLMMLSKDSGFKGRFSSIADSSDNCSVFLGTRSPFSPRLRIRLKNGVHCVHNGNEILKMKQAKLQEVGKGCFKNAQKRVESDTSIHERTLMDEFEKDLLEKEGTNRASWKHNSRKRDKIDGTNITELLCNITSRSSRCPLSASRASHSKRIQPCHGKTQIEQSISGKTDRKSGSRKVHKCPFCFRVFKSGQALGGHKRSHFVGDGEDRTLVINQQVSEMSMSALIDLNLPAPMEEEEEEEDGNGYYITSSW